MSNKIKKPNAKDWQNIAITIGICLLCFGFGMYISYEDARIDYTNQMVKYIDANCYQPTDQLNEVNVGSVLKNGELERPIN